MSEYTPTTEDIREIESDDCPDCGGQGLVRGEDRLLLCSRCDATGQVSTTVIYRQEGTP